MLALVNADTAAAFSWEPIAAVIGVLGLVGVGFAVATYFRQFPKRELRYRTSTQKLVASSLPAGTVSVSVHGVPLADPYITIVTFTSASRADIPSSSFDALKPIEVRVDRDAVLLEATAISPNLVGFDGALAPGTTYSQFDVPPQLVHPGASGAATFVTSGRPEVDVTATLIDIKIRTETPELDAQRERRAALWAATIGALASAIAGALTTLATLLWP